MLIYFLYLAPVFIVFLFVNSIAWKLNSTSALPGGTVLVVLSLLLCVALPLTVVGGIAGRNLTKEMVFPCRVGRIPREIPRVPVYRNRFLWIMMVRTNSAIEYIPRDLPFPS